ncbi:retrovirus-related pol polyprotein from transposon TNT 1-94 [Tanacetum coccineum]
MSRFLRWVEAKKVNSEAGIEKWRRLLLPGLSPPNFVEYVPYVLCALNGSERPCHFFVATDVVLGLKVKQQGLYSDPMITSINIFDAAVCLSFGRGLYCCSFSKMFVLLDHMLGSNMLVLFAVWAQKTFTTACGNSFEVNTVGFAQNFVIVEIYHVLVNANALNRSIGFDNPVRGLNPLGPPCQTDILWLIVDDGWMGRNADIKDGASRIWVVTNLIGECPKLPKDKNQKALVEGSWSDSSEEDDEKAKDETYLVAQASNCADNRPPMLEKDMYDSWKSRMELYMLNRQNANQPLIQALQADCDIKATNIILQGLPPEVYALKGESLREFYLRFSLLLNDMNIYNMKLEQFQVNTKFFNTLPPEWRKFMTDVKLVRDLHKMNIDQLHAYLGQHEFHANKLRVLQGLILREQVETILENKEQLSATTAKGKATCPNNATNQRGNKMIRGLRIKCQILHAEELAFLADPGISRSQATTDCFQNPFYLKKAQQLEPMLYVGDIIQKTNPIVIPDSEETLTLAEESRSKMLLKHKDNMMQEKIKQIDTTPIDYAALNKLYKDFETRFVPQTELSAEQAFWSHNSVSSSEPDLSDRPTNVEVPKELPKVSMVNTSLKKLKYHLANFDVVVKERTTPTAITEGTWGFEHTKACFRDEIIPFVKALKDLFSTFNQQLVDELAEVQNVFYQMEQAVEQHRVESKTFEVKMNQALNENERLLEQVMSKDIVNLIVNSSMDFASVNVHECEKCLKLETELQKDFVEKEIYDKLFKRFTTLEKHCISLEVDTQLNQEIFQRDNSISNQSAPSFDQLFELNELKAQSQEKDMVIKKLKERIKSLSGNMDKDKIKQDLEEIETINIELDHRVTKLIAENEHLKQTYKQLYDSIKPARVRSKEQCADLTNQVNLKSVEISDLNACLQEKVLVITTLKDELRKLKGKDLANNEVTHHPSDPEINTEPITPKLLNKRSAHSAYIKHTQEEAAVLRDLSDHIKANYPLDPTLESAYHVVAPKGTAHVQHSKLNANSELKCVKCNGCMLSDNHDLCVLDYTNNVNARNACPLTRITTTTEAPLRKPFVLDNETSKPAVTLVYSQKPRNSKTNVPVIKSKVLQSVSANKKEPSISWGSIISDVPSSSLNECRSSKLSSSTVKFGNDHVAMILGYGVYQIRNVMISRVYYVEGLGHNLFSVGQFCDSTLSKKKPHKPKFENNNQEKLYLLHMDLCGPIRVTSVNGKKYILVIVDDYSRFTWVKFLRSKDEALDFINKFLKMIQLRLKVAVRRIRTVNRTEFVNQTLREYYEKVGISHETSVARSPQQNGVIKRRNRMLIEAAHTMFIYAKALLFLWAEAVATACYTQNRST